MPADTWPDGRPLSEIAAAVEAGKAELRAEGVVPWDYDPTAPAGWVQERDDEDRPVTRWDGPPDLRLALAFLQTFLMGKKGDEAFEEWLWLHIWDTDVTCPTGLRRDLLRQVAERLQGAGLGDPREPSC